MTYDPTDPDDVLAEARTLANVGRHGEALACYEWFFANAVRIDRAHRGVRRSFVLSDWAKLGEVYPAARVSLIQQFTAAAECAKETGEIEAFLDADATSDYLGMQEEFIELLRDMMSRWPEIARKVYPRHHRSKFVRHVTSRVRTPPKKCSGASSSMSAAPNNFRDVSSSMSAAPNNFRGVSSPMSAGPNNFRGVSSLMSAGPNSFRCVSSSMSAGPNNFRDVGSLMSAGPKRFLTRLHGCVEFLSFDDRQRNAAATEGLDVLP